MKAGRALDAVRHALRYTFPRFVSLARELGLEIVGFVYIVFALFFLFSPFGFVNAYRQLPESASRLFVMGMVALVFLWFGLDSFRRAKRLARKR